MDESILDNTGKMIELLTLLNGNEFQIFAEEIQAMDKAQAQMMLSGALGGFLAMVNMLSPVIGWTSEKIIQTIALDMMRLRY